MASIKVNLSEPGSCHITHEASGAVLNTDGSPEFGGQGRSFSATDLVVAAIGACIMTSIDKVAARDGVDPALLAIELKKSLGKNPNRIEAIAIDISHPAGFAAELLPKLERAANSCAVKRSLNPEMAITIQFRQAS